MDADQISRYHPALARVKAIVESGELGKLKSVSGILCIPYVVLRRKDDNTHFNLELGGGIMMDMGCEYRIAQAFLTVHIKLILVSRLSVGSDPLRCIRQSYRSSIRQSRSLPKPSKAQH